MYYFMIAALIFINVTNLAAIVMFIVED